MFIAPLLLILTSIWSLVSYVSSDVHVFLRQLEQIVGLYFGVSDVNCEHCCASYVHLLTSVTGSKPRKPFSLKLFYKRKNKSVT